MMMTKGLRGLESSGAEAGSRAKRRSWSMAERQRIVEAALASGASVAGVARAHDINANLVFKWIRRSREGWRDSRCGAGKRAVDAQEQGVVGFADHAADFRGGNGRDLVDPEF